MAYKKKNQKPEQLLHTLDVEAPRVYEIERAILGAILLEQPAQSVISELDELLFYSTSNQLICRAIMYLYRKNSAIDLLTVSTYLKENGHLEEVGGAYYVASLTNNVSGVANIEFHIKILQENYLKRYIIHTCTTSIQKVISYGDDVFETYSELQASLDNGLKEILRYEISNIGNIHADMIVESINISEKGIKSGVPSHLKMVDNLTNGWQKADLIILAGRPSMGKTAAAVSMAIEPALRDNIPVLIFSLEMSSRQLGGRIQSSLSGVDVSRIIKNQLTKSEIGYIDGACQPLYKAPIFIDDTPNISLIELKSKSRKMVKEQGIKLIVIDYLQLMRSGLNIASREQEIAEISRGLKSLAKELDLPVIALSQLNRGVENKPDKKPGLSDLRESGQIEQDADMVLFCYRPEYYGIEQYEIGGHNFSAEGLFMLIVAKHRNGGLGEIPLRFIGSQTKLTNLDMAFTDNSNTFVQSRDNTNTDAPDNPPNNRGMQDNTGFLDNKDDVPF
jgi:replicative DNA helicase